MSPFAHVAPSADGLFAAMEVARRRRLRTAGTASSLTAATLSVVAVLWGSPGTQTLLQTPAPERPAVSTILEGPRPVPSPAPSGARSDGSGAHARFGGVAFAGASASEAPGTADEGTQVTDTVRGSRYAAGPLTRQEDTIGVPTCTFSSPEQAATRLCPYTAAQGTSPVQLYAELCSPQPNRSVLHFTGRNDLDFAIYRGTTQVWRWSQWHPDGGAPHTLALDTGECIIWMLNWTGVDAHGAPLPAGRYTLRTTFLARELSGRNALNYEFDLP